ncbi:unnamed protein product, partial [Hymenolepis diminuta]
FSSALFQDFCQSHNVTLVYFSPYHPGSNCQADLFFEILKQALQKSRGKRPKRISTGCTIKTASVPGMQQNHQRWKRVLWISFWVLSASHGLEIMKLWKSNPGNQQKIRWERSGKSSKIFQVDSIF